MRAVYHKGGYPDLEVDWQDESGNIDLTDYTVVLTVFPFGGATALTKNTGLDVQPLNTDLTVPSPNLVVVWSPLTGDDLDGLNDGQYVMKFTATHATKPQLELYGELIMRVNAPNFGYCEASDLLLGDLTISTKINRYDFINGAADEMNAEIGQRYTLPLDMTRAATWVVAKLKDINAQLATGRLVTAQAMSGGTLDNDLQAYGVALIKWAMSELCEIKDGTLPLVGVPVDPTSFRSNEGPAIRNFDSRSAIDAFALQPRHAWDAFPRRPFWQPGPGRCLPSCPPDCRVHG